MVPVGNRSATIPQPGTAERQPPDARYSTAAPTHPGPRWGPTDGPTRWIDTSAGSSPPGARASNSSRNPSISGVIVCRIAGGVAYSRRLYEEVLHAPATASTLIFPETVFKAPASHVSAFLGSKGINYTLVGDDGTFLQGLALAAEWLAAGRVDADRKSVV